MLSQKKNLIKLLDSHQYDKAHDLAYSAFKKDPDDIESLSLYIFFLNKTADRASLERLSSENSIFRNHFLPVDLIGEAAALLGGGEQVAGLIRIYNDNPTKKFKLSYWHAYALCKENEIERALECLHSDYDLHQRFHPFHTLYARLSALGSHTSLGGRVGRVPKNIVQYWDKEKIPNDVYECMKTWIQCNPCMTHSIFNKHSAEQYLLSRFGKEVAHEFSAIRHPAQQSDYFRIAYLSLEGGVYVDADDSCISELPEAYFDYSCVFLHVKKIATDVLQNCFLMASKNSRAYSFILKQIRLNLARDPGGAISLITGPNAVSKAVADSIYSSAYKESSFDLDVPKIIPVRSYWESIGKKNIHLSYKKTSSNWKLSQDAD